MAATKWVADPVHTEIQFKAKHLMITTVTGRFTDFHAELTTEDEDFSHATALFVAQTKSVSTNNDQRDTHLKSADFFDVENHPEMRFRSTAIRKVDEENFVMVGDLTIRDITRSVTLNVEFGGVGPDPWGGTRAGFSLSGRVNRKDWDLKWNAVIEGGGVIVGDEVRIMCEVQLVKQTT